MNGILLTRLVAYSCKQLSLFKENPKLERSARRKEGDAWREAQGLRNAYYKGDGFLKDVAASFIVDEVYDNCLIVHKMVTEEITKDYDKRWLCYVGAVLCIFRGELSPTTRSPLGSETISVPVRQAQGFLHLGNKWYEVRVIDSAAIIAYLRAKHFASKDRHASAKFDEASRNTYTALLSRSMSITEVTDPRG